MADISIILSPPRTFQAVVDHPRRASLSVVLKSGHERIRQSISLASPGELSSSSFEKTRPLSYHLHTLLLFTFSDLTNILVPQNILGLVTAISCCQSTSASSTTDILSRLPLAIIYIWIFLLAFCSSKQTQPASLVGDLKNKPWQPLASNRLTHKEARGVYYASSALGVLLSFYIGGFVEGISLMALTALYNDFGMGENGIVSRSVINAIGYSTFALGAVSVLTHNLPVSLGAQGYLWMAFLTVVVLMTGNCVDLEDQEGDVANGRRTIPLVLGDDVARHLIAGFMVVSTIAALRFWATKFAGSMFVFAIAGVVVKRLMIGEKGTYKTTSRLWTCWLVTLYLLPAMGRA